MRKNLVFSLLFLAATGCSSEGGADSSAADDTQADALGESSRVASTIERFFSDKPEDAWKHATRIQASQRSVGPARGVVQWEIMKSPVGFVFEGREEAERDHWKVRLYLLVTSDLPVAITADGYTTFSLREDDLKALFEAVSTDFTISKEEALDGDMGLPSPVCPRSPWAKTLRDHLRLVGIDPHYGRVPSCVTRPDWPGCVKRQILTLKDWQAKAKPCE